MDFEIFRPTLEASLFTGERKGNAGRPPIVCVDVQDTVSPTLLWPGDHQIEYQMMDHTSFRAFLGIENVDDVPGRETIWKYPKPSSRRCVCDMLFEDFRTFMEAKGPGDFKGRRIMNASFVVAPHASATLVRRMRR